MTVPSEPIFIGGIPVFVKFFLMARNPGDPSRIEGTLTLVGPEGVLTLDAIIGPQGDPGTPSPIIRPEWGSSVTNAADLPLVSTLDDSDNGRAWYINGQWHVFHEGQYYVRQGSLPGPPGVTPDISVSAELVNAGSPPVFGPIAVEETGPISSPNFHIKIPAVPGSEGPAAAIRKASDYDDSTPPTNLQVPAFDTEDNKWHPTTLQVPAPQMYTIPQASFTDYTGTSGRQLIASLNIAAQPSAWYPDVLGHVQIQRGLLSSAQVEVEVRIGDTGVGTGETEPLCGKGPYDPTMALFDASTIAHIMTDFSDDSDPLRSVAPDTTVARVPAGQAKTIYVFTHKKGGSGGYTFTKSNSAHLRVMVCPIADV